jgi:heme-binding NEAT domain protein
MNFETGTTYKGRFIGDADSVILLTVKARTAKTIKTADGKTLRVSVWNGVEQVKPFGSYSMAPIISADRKA